MKEKYLLSTIILLVFLILFTATSLALISGDFGSAGSGLPDGCVDSEDLMILTEAYGSTSSDSNWNPACDIAGPGGMLTPDGVINFEDLMIFAMHYGECDEDTSQSLITLSDSAIFDGKTVIDGGEHTITVRFPAPAASVRVFIANYRMEDADIIRNFWGIPSNAVEVFMSTVDGKTYTGTADFGMGDCDEEWIYVLTGDSCCPVIYSMTVTVDTVAPYVELAAVVVNCTDCDPAAELIISSDTCAYEDEVCPCTSTTKCGDACTTFDWTLTVYDAQPFKYDETVCDCVVNDCANIVNTASGTGCEVDLNVFGCVEWADYEDLSGKYYVVLTAEDIVSNPLTDYYILEVGGPCITGVDRVTFDIACLYDAILNTNNCLIEFVIW
jgi:hypothetical protein